MKVSTVASAHRLCSPAKPFDQVPRAKGFIKRLLPVPLDFIRRGGPAHLHNHIDDRHRLLGPIFRENMGPYELVSITDTDMIRAVIKNEGNYPVGKLPPAWSLYLDHRKLERGLFFQNGENWLKTRKSLDKILLDSTKIHMFSEASWFIANDLLDLWHAGKGGGTLYTSGGGDQLGASAHRSVEYSDDSFELNHHFAHDLSRWSIENIGFMLFGQRLGCLRTNVESSGGQDRSLLVEKANEMLDLSNKLQIMPVNLLQRVGAKIWRQFEGTMDDLILVARSISREAISKAPKESLVNNIMATSGLTKDEVIKNMIDFLIAAADTSAATITWALYLLAINPDVQYRARSEVITELSTRKERPEAFWPNFNQSLTYLNGLVRETMRLYPPAPFISRLLTQDQIIGGYLIPSDTLVIFPLITTGRMERYFKNPLDLKPERWRPERDLANKERDKVDKLASIPFGLGRRMCIGRKLAGLEINMLLAAVLSRYKIRFIGEEPIDIKLRMTTWPDKPIRLLLESIN